MNNLFRRRILIRTNNIPTGYTQLEYLSNHNTSGNLQMAYINPLVNCNEIGLVSSELCYTGRPYANLGDGALINNINQAFYSTLGMILNNNTPYYGVQFGGPGTEKRFQTLYVSGEFKKIQIDVLNAKAYCDNEEIVISINNVKDIPFYIFWRSMNRGTYDIASYAYGSKRKNIKIYDLQMNLIRDLIPVLNVNGIAGMLDVVNNMFYVSPNGSKFDQDIS